MTSNWGIKRSRLESPGFCWQSGATSTIFDQLQRIDVVFGGCNLPPGDRWKCLEVLCTPWKTNIAMGNPPFEDVSPITNGGFSLLC